MSDRQQAIYRYVLDSKSHPDAEEIFGEMRRMFPKISLGTVYRNLGMLIKSHKLRRISLSGQPDRFDDAAPHDHIICDCCGNIVDIPSVRCRMEDFPEGATIEKYEVTAYGYCAACSAVIKNGFESDEYDVLDDEPADGDHPKSEEEADGVPDDIE